ncbi:MAG: Plug domain-containing protein, partial [Pedobacter sp.]
MLKQICSNIILLTGLFWPGRLYAQKIDTLATVKVSTKMAVGRVSSPRPMQHIDKKTLETLNSVSVADATRFFSGVLLKDYGGLGGLKTISVRSLGAGYTGVMYDGVMLSDVQAGQIDLGKISTANIENITLYNGQPLAI